MNAETLSRFPTESSEVKPFGIIATLTSGDVPEGDWEERDTTQPLATIQ